MARQRIGQRPAATASVRDPARPRAAPVYPARRPHLRPDLGDDARRSGCGVAARPELAVSASGRRLAAAVNDPQQVRCQHDLLLGVAEVGELHGSVRVRVLVEADRAGEEMREGFALGLGLCPTA
jgi:hypothetical protein